MQPGSSQISHFISKLNGLYCLHFFALIFADEIAWGNQLFLLLQNKLLWKSMVNQY